MVMITSPHKIPAQQEVPTKHTSERREKERRKEKCEGYIYVDTVGWYCRRAQNRRKTDSLR